MGKGMRDIIIFLTGVSMGLFFAKLAPPPQQQRIIRDTVIVTDTIDYCHTEEGLFVCTDGLVVMK